MGPAGTSARFDMGGLDNISQILDIRFRKVAMRKAPHVLVISFVLVVLAAAATWLIPGGAYERRVEQVGETTREVVVPGSFRPAPSNPQVASVFSAPARGFLRLGTIVVFILVVGGAFAILNETGALGAGIHLLLRGVRHRTHLVIPLVMLLFSFFGGAFGMAEEGMPFALIFVPLAIALGYDSIVGISMTFVAANVGFSAGFTNPFTVQIGQGIAGVQPLSGLGYRVLLWAAVTALTIAWVMVYAARVKAEPRRSPMYELDSGWRDEIAKQGVASHAFTWRNAACLGVLGATTVALMAGVIAFKWGILDLAGLFVAMGITAGLIAGLGPSAMARAFITGCKDMTSAAMVVAFAGGIIVILEQGGILDSILHGMAGATARLGGVLAAQVVYGLTAVLNFFIPSGSTKAVLTLPLLAPLADLSGITRQTVVLAYQLGSGFACLVMPTSGVTVGSLAIARIPFDRWVRWQWPMQVMFVLFSLAALVWPVLASWQ